jgi:hypothetical protein
MRRRAFVASSLLWPSVAAAQPLRSPLGGFPAGSLAPLRLEQLEAPGGVPGATLDLSFNGPTLDPRLTFTRGSTATYFDATGTMQTAASGAPRYDYDPVTHALNGLLIEEARTNVVTNSGALTNHVTVASTRTAAAISAPDGTLTGVRLTEDTTTNSDHSLDFIFTPAGSTAYTHAVYVKAGIRTFVAVELRSGANWIGGNTVAVANLTAGTIANPLGVATAFTIQNAGNGWYRITVSGTTIASPGAITFRIALCDNAGNWQYTGDGSSYAYFWGDQIEAGAFPTSYIPTTAATVTRSVENCTAPVGAWFVTQLGTLQIEGMQAANWNKSAEYVGFTGPNGKTSINVQGSNFVAILDSIGAYNSGMATVPLATPFRAAHAFASGVQRGALSGAVLASFSVAALTSGNTTLTIGSDGLSLQCNGWVRRVRYWPRVLSNTELQSVTR